MKRLLVGMIVAATMTAGAPPAVAHAAEPHVECGGEVPGHYTVYVYWSNIGHRRRYSMRLRATGTGRASHHDPVVWQLDGSTFTMTIGPSGSSADYTGTLTSYGLNTLTEQGTMSNSTGATGTWYAQKRCP